MESPSTSYSFITAASETIPKGKSSIPPATDRKTLASADSTSLKNPTTATSASSMKDFAVSTVSRVLAGGPVFFSNQETIVSAVRPPEYSMAFPFLKNFSVGYPLTSNFSESFVCSVESTLPNRIFEFFSAKAWAALAYSGARACFKDGGSRLKTFPIFYINYIYCVVYLLVP